MTRVYNNGAVLALVFLAMWSDLLAIGVLAALNRWRVVQDHPPALVPGYSARIVAYVVLVIIGAIALRYMRRAPHSRGAVVAIVVCVVLLILRAIALGPLYPWGARDVAEFAAAKGAVDVVANEGLRHFEQHGRVADSLGQLNLPAKAAKDPWGFRIGFEPAPGGFRVFVRGAPYYISHRDEMARRLVQNVILDARRPE